MRNYQILKELSFFRISKINARTVIIVPSLREFRKV